MADTVLPPSPNWYLSNIMCVSSDGTIIYGSSTNDITILRPVSKIENKQRFKIDIITSAHKKRVTCLALSPDWSSTQLFVSGSEDGIVKLWNQSTLSFSIAHNVHFESSESVAGVTFLNDKEVVSVGTSGVIVLWNTQKNIVKSDNRVIKMYKPLCISVCPLKQNTIAIGTKQGVVLVLSVTDKFMILYKAHGHDTEVTSLSWCPTSYCDPLEKFVAMKRHKVKTLRIRKFSNRKLDSSSKSVIATNDSGLYQQSSGEEADESDIFDVNKDTGNDECREFSDSDSDRLKKVEILESTSKSKDVENLSEAFKNIELANEPTELENNKSFLDDCKKLLEIMNSKKALKASMDSFIVDPDDSVLNESQADLAEQSDLFDIYQEPPFHEFGHSKYVPERIENDNVSNVKISAQSESSFLEECQKLECAIKGEDEDTEADGTLNNLDQTVDKSILEKSDIFDLYKDPPIYEFGHEKYVPTIEKRSEDVSATSACTLNDTSDFLDECKKLKQKIVEGKSEDKSSENESVSNVSNQIQKLNIANSDDSPTKVEESSETQAESRDGNYLFLASICKNGKVCIWKWGGNLVLSADVVGSKENKLKKKGLPWGVVFWLSSKSLLVATKNANLFRCNFNTIYPKTKTFGFSLVHDQHIRGLYCIASNTTNELESSWRNRQNFSLVWTIGQDRLLIAYSPDENKVVTSINTFGGFVSDIAVSAIDPNRFAISCGDGMVRVWDYSPNCEENNGMGEMKVFWLNVQGKVQACDWHPIKENLIAFGNSEGRIGLIDSNSQNSTKHLPSSLSLGVNGLLWEPNGNHLYAHGAGKLVMYGAENFNQDPEEIIITVLDRKWEVSAIAWSDEYFTVGSKEGGVVVLTPTYPHENVAYSYPHRKLVNCISWHPLAVSSDDGQSPCADLIAVSSYSPTIAVLKLVSDEDGAKLEVVDEIMCHSLKVNRVCWSPHHNGRLLSASADRTVMVYDVINKRPLHTLLGHVMSVLCCVWCPTESNLVMTAGEDFSLRVWNIDEHPYQEIKSESSRRRRKMKLASTEIKSDNMATLSKNGVSPKKSINKLSNNETEETSEPEPDVTLAQGVKSKHNPPVTHHSALHLYGKQTKDASESIEGCKRLFNYQISKMFDKDPDAKVDCSGGFDYLKIYGSYEDLCEYLDLELEKSDNSLNWNIWMKVGLLRGNIKTVLERAKEKNKLNPALLCLAPTVSIRFWKDVASSFSTEQVRLKETFGIEDTTLPLFQGLLSLASGKLEEACKVFVAADLIVDALVAAKLHHNDQIVNDCFQKLIDKYRIQCRRNRIAECHLALGELMDAAVVLGQSNNEEYLSLASTIAKQAGDNVLAKNMEHASISNSKRKTNLAETMDDPVTSEICQEAGVD